MAAHVIYKPISKIKAVLEVQSHCKVESPILGFNGSTIFSLSLRMEKI